LSRSGHRRTRILATLGGLATAISLCVVPSQTAVADPPPNPSDSQIHNAQARKDALAGEVGRLGARVAQLRNQLGQLQAEQALAEQKVAYAIQKLQDARAAAEQAQQDVAAAHQGVVDAQQDFVKYAQAVYMSGQLGGTTGTLLTADDPNVLLEASALRQYQSTHQLTAIGNLQRATVAKSNADAAARQAVQRQTAATQAAKKAKQDADAKVVATRAQQREIQATLEASQNKLDKARSDLAGLNNQRAAYNAWVAEQARIKAERERQQRLAREAAERAARQRAAQNNGGGGGGNYPSTPPPQGGSWSAARGQEAVNRAMSYLGWMYAWAGGNAYGPTRGVCAGDGAFNDCNVVGFDCSGLVMYAWGPYMRLDHYAATQFTQAGRYHPSTSDLRPGDLVFWSSNGTIAGIHHVAIYIGGGNVVQAPQSGSVIQVTPLGQVSWGYFGATRPLS
jgi:cell wall-associated NlpC family hydrolase